MRLHFFIQKLKKMRCCAFYLGIRCLVLLLHTFYLHSSVEARLSAFSFENKYFSQILVTTAYNKAIQITKVVTK